MKEPNPTQEHEQEAQKLRQGHLPRHLAIIMDGNGRWARERGLPRVAGHEEGMKAVRETVRACGELGIPILTLYAFSSENWSRPPDEVRFLMDLLVRYIRSDLRELDESNVSIRVFGQRDGLSRRVRHELERAVEKTRDNTGLILGLAFNYGGRQEIVRAVRGLAAEVAAGKLDPRAIRMADVERQLYTAGLPDPDLIVRTSGELRLSNFLLWQAAYAEFWWTPCYWPDFGREELFRALNDFQKRERRFGGIGESG